MLVSKGTVGIDFPGISVVVLCHDNRSFLMLRRGPKSRDEIGKWDVVGGQVEFGETAVNAVIREVKEEIHGIVRDVQFLGYRNVFRTIDSKPTHWVALDFMALIDVKIKISEPHKIDALRWSRFDDMPDKLHSQFHLFAMQYTNQLAKFGYFEDKFEAGA